MKHPSIRNHQSDLSETIRNCIKSHHASATLLPLVQVIAWKGICLTVDRVEITLSAWCWCWWLILFSRKESRLNDMCVSEVHENILCGLFIFNCVLSFFVRLPLCRMIFHGVSRLNCLTFSSSKFESVDVCIRRTSADCWSSFISPVSKKADLLKC